MSRSSGEENRGQIPILLLDAGVTAFATHDRDFTQEVSGIDILTGG